MAKHLFKPGKSGNPKGRPKKPETILFEIPIITKQEVIDAYNKFMHMPIPELEKYVQNKQGTAFEYTVARILAMAAVKGDPLRLDFLLNRLIGKVADKIDHSVTHNPFTQMTEQEKLEKAKEVVELLEQSKKE